MRTSITIGLSILLTVYIVASILLGIEIFAFVITTMSILLSILSVWIPTTKEVYFKVQDWDSNGERPKLVIPRSQHRLGKKVTCELYEESPLQGYQQVHCDIYTNFGDITLFVGKNGAFNGKILIKG